MKKIYKQIKTEQEKKEKSLLYSLSESFNVFRCAIESRDDLPSPETVQIEMIEKSNARRSWL